jgi:cobalt-zinc-cadmium efflux system membrane fusion protein
MITLRPILCPALCLALTACSGSPPKADAAMVPAVARDTALLSARAVSIAQFGTARVTRQAWRATWQAPGRLALSPGSTQALGSNVEGRITKVYVLPGDRVVAGQVLVTIHSHEMLDARARFAQAKISQQQADADLRLASSQTERAERLFTARALSQADLDRARTALLDATSRRDGAMTEFTRAESFLEHLVGTGPVPPGTDEHDVLIRSPIEGVVVSRSAQDGAVMTVGAPLVVVSRTSALTLLLQVPEQAMAAAKVGSDVRFTVATWPGRIFSARIARVAPAVDSMTRSIEVQANVLDGMSDLRAEQFASAEIAGPAGPPVLAVPASAIQSLEGDTVVIATTQRGDGMHLEAVHVKVGRRTGEWAELVEGADTTRAVVTSGAAVAKAEILKRRTAN